MAEKALEPAVSDICYSILHWGEGISKNSRGKHNSKRTVLPSFCHEFHIQTDLNRKVWKYGAVPLSTFTDG